MIDLANLSVNEFSEGIRNNNRVILSRAITLLESRSSEQREKGWEILEKCAPYSGKSIRVGITGPPGAGKSTFIESIGKITLQQNRKLAIIAIDPSSKKFKGSILGDKTRMQELSKLEHVFIRPSASGEFSGGVHAYTREVILLLEAAGYDTIFVETVGVGQNETSVVDLVDIFLMITIAGAGDELQGIKRGIMELADLIVINKSDGDNIPKVKIAAAELKRALDLFPPSASGISPAVLSCSSVSGEGVTEVWDQIISFIEQTKKSGHFNTQRNMQMKTWMYEMLQQELLNRLTDNKAFKSALQEAEKEIDQNHMNSFIILRKKLSEILSNSTTY